MTAKHSITAFFGILFVFFVAGRGVSQAQLSQFSELEYPYEVQYQELDNGHRVAYIDEGEGPTLMLIHGLGSYIPAWKKNISELSKSYRVIAVDLPGYGKSSKKVKEYSIPLFVETVAGLQEALEIEKATWMGHSMGGQVALRGAVSNPEKIERLVLLAPAGFETFTEQEGAMMTNFVTPESIQATPDSVVRQTFRATFFDFPKEAEFMIEDRIAIRDAKEFENYSRAYAGSVRAMLEDPVADELSSIKQSALILFGKQDMLIPNRQFHADLTPQKVAESGHANLPNSTLKMVDKTGHFVHFEKSEVVNQEIVEFLNQE
ncbi:MAG: alpha/beta fold hydrolase [Bacteroidota bacterium]